MRAKISKDVKKPKRNENEPSSLAIRVLDFSFLSLFGIFFLSERGLELNRVIHIA